jgi:hypothetical protein
MVKLEEKNSCEKAERTQGDGRRDPGVSWVNEVIEVNPCNAI